MRSVRAQGDAYPMENTGFLYVTMVGLSTGLAKAVHVMHVYNVTDVIREEQLQAVKDLFYQTCYPTQHLIPTFPTNQPWRKAEHVEGHYSVLGTWPWKEQFSTNGGERVSLASLGECVGGTSGCVVIVRVGEFGSKPSGATRWICFWCAKSPRAAVDTMSSPEAAFALRKFGSLSSYADFQF